MRKRLTISLIALAHYISVFVLAIVALGGVGAWLDKGTAATPFQRFAGRAHEVLTFPASQLIDLFYRGSSPELLGQIFWVLSSLLWGVVLYYAVSWVYFALKEQAR